MFIYLLYESLLPPQCGRHTTTPRKERRRKEQGFEKMGGEKDRGTEGETPAIDALIRGEEKTGKKKRTKKQGVGLQPSYPGPFGHLLRPNGIIQ